MQKMALSGHKVNFNTSLSLEGGVSQSAKLFPANGDILIDLSQALNTSTKLPPPTVTWIK